ncbi:FUSC family protein [Pseudoduganella umbonata]|uniref:FUSC family protein n=1 Tax=Pseudoduganella umbonata TaxID=864828 RepID=A0A4P8HZ55_9BURK|nr:FUSC family protein [Pseudoduganella umbonata]MBB3223245.1 putative membrane protein YccC [Pseudoduganella umbonata]QCP13834.1 FUSC family protein [Pseudoduganella umbonata]
MTPESAAPASLPGLHWLRRELRGWAATDGVRILFVVRTLAAAYAALWLAFRLGLDSPATAMTTTFVLALPASGMVLEKALYRLLGTVVGCAAALALAAVFPQQAPPLFAGLALWIALCTMGAAMHRNQQSYSFVLAGYTACMIVVPALDAPAGVFALAVTRTTEVGLGVLVAAVVHDVLLPRHHGRQVMRAVRGRHRQFLAFCRQVLEHRLPPAEAELHHLRFAADIAALESGRAAAVFEAGTAQARQLHAFNGAFMTALTTFHTLHRLLHRQRHDAASPVPALVQPLEAVLASALASGAPPATLPGAVRQAAALARAALPADADADTAAHRWHIDFDTAAELAERFAGNLVTFTGIHDGLATARRMPPGGPLPYAPKTPPGIVAASGFRAACAMLAAATLWYWLAWAPLANALVMTTIFCALASGSPRPTAMVRQVLAGFALGVPLTFATQFLLVARADGYPAMMLATAPLLGFAAWLMTDPKRTGAGIGMAMFSSQFLAPANLMHYDAGAVLNNMLGQLAGVLLALVVFHVVLPGHTMGNRAHVAAALWREALSTCTARLRGRGERLRHRFDNRVRDLLAQLNAAAGPAPSPETRAVVRQALTLLELGHAVIELRVLLQAGIGSRVAHAVDAALQALAAYLAAPREDTRTAAIYALRAAGPVVRAGIAVASAPVTASASASAPVSTAGADAACLRLALTDLHSIYTALLDQVPQPALNGNADAA